MILYLFNQRANMDLTKLNLNQLRALRQQLQQELVKRHQQEMANARKAIVKIAHRVGIPLQALVSDVPLFNSKGPAPVKFRHPDNPALQWSGRGHSPAWVVVWEREHGSRDGITISSI